MCFIGEYFVIGIGKFVVLLVRIFEREIVILICDLLSFLLLLSGRRAVVSYITTDLQSSSFLYADDTSLLEVVDDPDVTTAKLNDDLELINTWTHKWLVTINSDKTKSMVFSTKRQKPLHPQLKYDNQIIESVSNHKHLGVTLSSNLLWRTHVFNIYEKA